MVALVNVGDILLTGNNETAIAIIKQALHKAFTIKDLGHICYFLRLKLQRMLRAPY